MKYKLLNGLSIKLICLTLALLVSNCCQADSANLLSSIPGTRNVSVAPQTALHMEMHAATFLYGQTPRPANTCPNSTPLFNCSNGGTVIPSSYTQNSADNCTYYYACFVSYDNHTYSSDPTVQAKKTGWVTTPLPATPSEGIGPVVVGTPAFNPYGEAVTEQVTLMYPNGWPATNFETDSGFQWGNYWYKGASGTGELCSAGVVNFNVNNSVAPPTATSGSDTCGNGTSVNVIVAPGQNVSMSKTVSHDGGWTDTCLGNYVVQLSDIGQNLNMVCCPDYNGQVNNTNNSGSNNASNPQSGVQFGGSNPTEGVGSIWFSNGNCYGH